MGHRRTIDGLRILITGASQGIGRALALEAAKRGAHVLAAARNDDLLAELVAEARALGKTVHARLRKIFEVNFFGLTETTRVCLPLLKEGKTPAILNISSIAARRGLPARSDYSASKFAVQGFSEAIRSELAKDGIDVLLVNPGLTQTNFSKNMIEQKAKMQLDHMRGMTSEQVAAATLDALARGSDEVTFTFQGRLLLLVNRFFPWFVDWMSKRKVRELFKDEIAARKQGTPAEAAAS